MTIAVRAVTAPSQVSATSTTRNKPTGTLEGDLLLMVAYLFSAVSPRFETPDGWIEITEAFVGGDDAFQVFRRVAEVSEPANYTVSLPSGAASQVISAGIIAFYSDTAEPIRVEAADVVIVDVSDTTREWPTVTVASATQMLVYVGTYSTNIGSTGSATERWDVGSSPRTYAQTESHSGSGVVGGATATAGVAGTYRNATIALTEDTQELLAGPQYRATGSGNGGTVDGSQSADIPATVEAGDLLIANLVFGTDRTPTMPAGWEVIPDALQAGAGSLHSYYKIAESGDAGDTVTATFAAGSIVAAMAIVAWYSPRGYELEIEQAVSQSNGSSANHEFPSATVVADKAALLFAMALALNGGTTAPNTSWERKDVATSSANRLYMMTEVAYASGATGTRTATSTAATSRTATIVIVEVEPEPEPCVDGAGYTFNGIDITDYCNELDLQSTAKELEATNFDSTGSEADAGLAEHSIRLGGDWNQELDDLLGPDAMSGRRRTGIATLRECPDAVTYTWTGAYLTGWQVFTVARGKAGWRAVLRHDGAPIREVIEI